MADARLTRLVDHLKPGYLDETDEQIIARLEALPLVAEPDATFRAELRSRLLTMAPDLMAAPELEADEIDEAADRFAEPAQIGWQRHYPALRKPLLVAASAAAVLVVLLGMSVWLSGNALPGQALYGLKRASENVQLSVTHGDTAKGKKYLDFASIRISEAAKLIGASNNAAGSSGKAMAGGVSAHTQQLVISTLNASNADVKNGTKLITSAAVADRDPRELAPLTQFTIKQHANLTNIESVLPAGAAKTLAGQSAALVKKVAARATELRNSVGCTCINPNHTDYLGPKPCKACPASKRHTSAPSGKQSTPGAPYVTPGGSGSGSRANNSGGAPPSTDPGGGGGGGQSSDSSSSVEPPSPSNPQTSEPSPAPSSDPSSDSSPSDSSSGDGGSGAQTDDPSVLLSPLEG